MALSLDPERQVQADTCECCGLTSQLVKGFMYRDGVPHAVYFAACHPHQPETWIDVILGTWDEDGDDERVTFGCRAWINERQEVACGLGPAALEYSASPLFGEKLDRERALVHPWLGAFWEVVDFILEADPTVRPHMHPGST